MLTFFVVPFLRNLLLASDSLFVVVFALHIIDDLVLYIVGLRLTIQLSRSTEVRHVVAYQR